MNRQQPARSSSASLNPRPRDNLNISGCSTSRSASIISLARLKNYQPNDGMLNKLLTSERAAHLQTADPTVQSDNVSPKTERSRFLAHASSLGKPQQQTQSSGLVANVNCSREKANTYCASLRLAAESSGIADAQNSCPQLQTAFPTTVADRVSSSATQQESERPQRQPQKPTNTDRLTLAGETKDCAQEAECAGQLQTQAQQERQQRSLVDRPERKRKKIDGSASSNKEVRSRQVLVVGSRDTSCLGNNMTPSSLLLIQNSNHLRKRQQSDQAQQTLSGGCSDNGEQRVSLPANIVTQTSEAKQINDGLQPISRQAISGAEDVTTITKSPSFSQSNGDPSSLSLSAHMSNSADHFRISNSSERSNSSTVNIVNSNDFTNSSSKGVGPSNYFTRDSLNSAHNLQTITSQAEAPAVAAGSSGRLDSQQSYQQSLAACDLRLTSGLTNLAQYKAPNDRLQNQYYNSNFMLNQQVKPLNALGLRAAGCDENSNSTSAYDRNETHLEASGLNSLAARDTVAQQQARTAYHYYGGQYNLIPTASSKLSSPNSTNSTPSPRTHTMQAINVASHNSSQLLAAGLGANSSAANISAAESHLEQLNHHYMNSNASVSEASSNHQQQLQVNQHYSYNQQTTGDSNQHHIAIANHEAAYAHNHHQQQQQRHAQLNVANQQSIYHQIPNNTSGNSANLSHSNYNNSANIHYQSHLQAGINSHQTNNLMVDAHQNHLNSAAAACAAAAVVSRTLKTVASQHNQHQNHYASANANGLAANPGNLMNMTAQHHQQFHNVNSLGQQHWIQSQTMNMQQNHNQQIVNHHHHHQQQQQQQQTLSVHQAAAVVTRKYQCKMCPQVFMSKAEMKYHNQNHMREAKPYKCLHCPKAFANSSYLSQHMRIHQGLKPYACDICSRKFTQLSHLQQHKRTHTGDKPYKCTYMNCTKQFSQLSNLQSHSRCHQLDKPYKCNSCYKCFHDEPSLLEHIPRHLESKHLKKNLCIFCGSSYQQERGLVKHFQQYHTDKTPTLVAAAIAAGTTGNTSLIASLISSTQSGVFATPSSGSSASSASSSLSSSSSLGSTGLGGSVSVNGHNGGMNSVHGTASGYSIGRSFL